MLLVEALEISMGHFSLAGPSLQGAGALVGLISGWQGLKSVLTSIIQFALCTAVHLDGL